jgi:hypothetical protein
MPDAKTLRERAATCRRVAETRSAGGRVYANPYLDALAQHYDEQAEAAEALEQAEHAPKVR